MPKLENGKEVNHGEERTLDHSAVKLDSGHACVCILHHASPCVQLHYNEYCILSLQCRAIEML